jgi:hypothetical protein
MLSCKINPKLRFLANWHKGQPILDMTCTGSKPHTHQLAQEARVSIATRAREREVSIATRVREKNRNKGENKQGLVVSCQSKLGKTSHLVPTYLI